MLLLLFMIIILLFFPLLASLSSSSQIKKRGFESRILEACLLDTGPRIGLLRGQSSACPQSADMDAHLHTFLRRNTGGDITTATPSLPEASANRGVSVGLLPSSRYCSREFSSSAVCSRIPGFVVVVVVVVASVRFLCESWAPSPPPWDVSLIPCQTRIIRRRLASKKWIRNTFSIDSTNFRVTFQAFPRSGTKFKEPKVTFLMSLVIFASVEKNQME